MKLELLDVDCGYKDHVVLSKVNFTVETGEAVYVLGPNGSGKTTLFKAIQRHIRLLRGDIIINGEKTHLWSSAKLAKVIGYVPQIHNLPFPFKTLDVVLMGRTAHVGVFQSPSKKDIRIAQEAMGTLGITCLQDKSYTELSGGEKQMVMIARALAQQPKMLILDEPTNNLDFGHQVEVLRQVELLAQKGLAILMATHVPDHALMYATKVLLVQNGRVEVQGRCGDIVTEKNLERLYGVKVKIRETTTYSGDRVKVCITDKNRDYHINGGVERCL